MDYDRHTFEQLYKANYRQMYRLAYALLENADEARDAVHQVFASLWQTQSVVTDESMTSYLLIATRNHCLHLLRLDKSRKDAEEMFIRDMQSATARDDHEELLHQLHLLIDSHLTPRDRQVLSFHFGKDMTYQETAAALDVSPSAVNKHVTRSLAILRKHLTGKGK